jgi:hypothetical protein
VKSTALRLLLVAVAMVVAACTFPDSPDVTNEPADQPAAEQADEQRFPDVVEVSVERTGDTYSFSVTISSPYDSPQRYADGWRVMGPDGTVYGEHTLAHDHANEQPFTRTQTGVEIPDDITEVIVEGRDLEHGYGGDTKTVQLP